MTSRTECCMQTPNKPSLFNVQYLRNHQTLDIGVLGYIVIVWPKEHSPEVRSFPPGTPCIFLSLLKKKSVCSSSLTTYLQYNPTFFWNQFLCCHTLYTFLSTDVFFSNTFTAQVKRYKILLDPSCPLSLNTQTAKRELP